MSYIYSERARCCVNTEDVDHIEIIKIDSLPKWYKDDGITDEEEQNNTFPYTIRIIMKTNKNDGSEMINFFTYGYYVDDIEQVKDELQKLAAKIWGANERPRRNSNVSYSDYRRTGDGK